MHYMERKLHSVLWYCINIIETFIKNTYFHKKCTRLNFYKRNYNHGKERTIFFTGIVNYDVYGNLLKSIQYLPQQLIGKCLH